MEVHLPIAAKRTGATQIVELVLRDQISDHGRLLCWGLCSRKPRFNCWDQVACVHLLYLQITTGEERQEFADGERTGMRRITELFEAILLGSSSWIFADHQVFHGHDALYATDTRHFSKHQPRIATMVQRKAGDDDIKCLLLAL